MGKKQTLGIIVNSNRYFSFVMKLADAAMGSGKQVRIHLLGSGWEFIKTDACKRLSRLTRMSLCVSSVPESVLPQLKKIEPGISLVAPHALSVLLKDCYRYVVF